MVYTEKVRGYYPFRASHFHVPLDRGYRGFVPDLRCRHKRVHLVVLYPLWVLSFSNFRVYPFQGGSGDLLQRFPFVTGPLKDSFCSLLLSIVDQWAAPYATLWAVKSKHPVPVVLNSPM